MRFSKFILTATFWIELFLTDRLHSQTYIIPNLGISSHSIAYKHRNVGLGYSYEGLKNKVDVDIGLDLKHYLLPKWFISINSGLYLRNHTYTFFTNGFNPRSDYSYRLVDYGISSGIEVANNLEIGIGLSGIFFFNRKVIHSDMIERRVDSKSLYSSVFVLSYKWDKFIAKISYSKSLSTSNMYAIDLFSIHFGYQWKVFEPIQRKSKVNCPKL